MSQPLAESAPLRAPLEIEFDYTRSLGPVLSQFMAALAGRRILGARGGGALSSSGFGCYPHDETMWQSATA